MQDGWMVLVVWVVSWGGNLGEEGVGFWRFGGRLRGPWA